jgi:hypothetical protein
MVQKFIFLCVLVHNQHLQNILKIIVKGAPSWWDCQHSEDVGQQHKVHEPAVISTANGAEE